MDTPKRKSDPRYTTRFSALMMVLMGLGVVSFIITLVVYYQTRISQALIPAWIVLAAMVLAGPLVLLARAGFADLTTTLLMFGGAIALSAPEAAWTGLTWYLIAGSLLLIINLGAVLAPGQHNRYFVVILAYLVVMLLMNRVYPIERSPAVEAPLLIVQIIALDVFLGILLFTQILAGRRIATIRSRLVVGFVLLVALPLISTTAASSYLNIQSQKNQTLERLDAIASLKETEVYNLLQNIQVYLGYTLPTPEEISDWELLLKEDASTSAEWQSALDRVVLYKLNSTLLDTQVFDEISVIDLQGVTKASTSEFKFGVSEAANDTFREGLKGYIIGQPASQDGKWAISAAMPIRDMTGEVIGVVMGRLIVNELNQIMMNTPGLGASGNIFLVQKDSIGAFRILTPMDTAPFNAVGAIVPGESMAWIDPNSQAGAASHRNLLDVPAYGAYRYIPSLGTYILIEQLQAESQGVVLNSVLLNAGIGILSLVIAIIAALVVTRQMTQSLVRLGKTSEQIAAGDLTQRVIAEQDDEVGVLAQSLDRMTRQMRELIDGLETRVNERTAEVERRSTQLQVASQVARDTTALHDLDELLKRAVELISQRFDFYHVGIFLVNDEATHAILRAATGEAGKKMLERGHKLRVGEEGIVGYVTSSGQPRIALDVGADATHFHNPLLPHTRSEMALPLRSGDRIIGALDVQSTHGSAFDQQDITILQTLTDQLAVAIENARLFNTMNDTVLQLQVAQQQFTQEAWRQFIRNPRHARSYRYRGSDIEISDIDQSESDDDTTLKVPLRIRDQAVGFIRLKMDQKASESEIQSTVEEISSRLSLVLESARLLEETQLRSEQFRLLQEITSSAAMNIEMTSLLNDITAKVLEGFNMDHCSVILFDPDRANGTVISNKPDDEIYPVGERIQISDSPLFVEVLKNEKSIVAYDAQKDPRTYTLNDFLTVRAIRTLVVTPLVVRGEVQGVIVMGATDPNHPVGHEDLRLLDQIGLQVSVGLDVARLFEMTEQRAQHERMIGDIANQMRESLEIDNVLKTAAREIRKALNLEDITIHLSVPDDRTYSQN